MLANECVYALGVRLKKCAITRGELLRYALGHHAQAHGALLLVIVHPGLARTHSSSGARNRLRRRAGRRKNLRHLTAYRATREVHLPQAVLRRHVALGEEQVFELCCGNVRHAVRIADHRNGRLQSSHADGAIELRQGRARAVIKPEERESPGNDHKQQDPENDLERDAEKTFARSRSSNTCSHGP